MEVDFMKKRVNTAFWVEKENRWCIAVQKNGTRKRFYSSTPGRTGQREANAKADAWLDDSIRDGKKKVAALYAQWVEELKLTCGTSYVEQCKKYGDYYILPVCGDIRIDELTEGDLQKAINMSFKKRCLKKERQRRSSDKPFEPQDHYDDPGCGNRLCQVVPKEQVHDTLPRPVYPEECQDGETHNSSAHRPEGSV